MSSDARRCPGCGRESPRPEARFCEHCGGALEPTPVAPARDPFGDVAARFRALNADPELERWLATMPDVPELAGRTLPSLLLLGALTLVGLFLSLFFLQLCPPLGFVPLALVVTGAVVAGRNLLWRSRAPLVARAALVAELRAQLQAGAEHSPASTRHHVTLQWPGGERSEHECLASAVPALELGALGVAYLKGERLAAFVPLGASAEAAG